MVFFSFFPFIISEEVRCNDTYFLPISPTRAKTDALIDNSGSSESESAESEIDDYKTTRKRRNEAEGGVFDRSSVPDITPDRTYTYIIH